MGQSHSSQLTSRKGFDTPIDYAEKLYTLNSKDCVLLSFLSPHCRLCTSLRGDLDKVKKEREDLKVVEIDSLNRDDWAPELIRYNIEKVPCFVLLNSRGRAIGKTEDPINADFVRNALHALITEKRKIV